MKAYLVTLTGMGDIDLYVANEATWQFIQQGAMQDLLVQDYITAHPRYTAEQAESFLTTHPHSSNDRALVAAASRFNGESFRGTSVLDMMRFVAAQNLQLQDEFQGNIY